MTGDLHTARKSNDRALQYLPMDPYLLTEQVLLEYEEGNYESGELLVDRLRESIKVTDPERAAAYVQPAIACPMASRIADKDISLDWAEGIANAVLGSPRVNPAPAHAARFGLAMIAALRNDAELARAQYTGLLEGKGTVLFFGQIPYDRVLGLISQTMGNLNQAASHFEDSLTFCRKAGYRPELAWTCCDYADTLLQRNEPGDHEKATTLLDESLAISSELGMRPLMERVISRREILKA